MSANAPFGLNAETRRTLAIAVTCSVASSLLGCGITWWMMQRRLAADFAMRPPIAVISVPDWMVRGSDAHPSEAGMATGLGTAKRAIAKLQTEGVLVLDARAVRGGPEEVMLSPPAGSRQ
jgi:hypothetical protein